MEGNNTKTYMLSSLHCSLKKGGRPIEFMPCL